MGIKIDENPVENNARPTDSRFIKVDVKEMVQETKKILTEDAKLDLSYEKFKLPKPSKIDIQRQTYIANGVRSDIKVAIGANFDMRG